MLPIDPLSTPESTYTLSGCGIHTAAHACPHTLTAWVEAHTPLTPAQARALATEALLSGWAGTGRIELRRL